MITDKYQSKTDMNKWGAEHLIFNISVIGFANIVLFKTNLIKDNEILRKKGKTKKNWCKVI